MYKFILKTIIKENYNKMIFIILLFKIISLYYNQNIIS